MLPDADAHLEPLRHKLAQVLAGVGALQHQQQALVAENQALRVQIAQLQAQLQQQYDAQSALADELKNSKLQIHSHVATRNAELKQQIDHLIGEIDHCLKLL